MTWFRLHISDAQAALQSHLYLRLAVLTLCTLVLGAVHVGYQPLTHLVVVLGIIAASATWTVAALRRPAYAAERWRFPLELALDYLWVLGVVALLGRSVNPFIYYYLVLAAIGASVLAPRLAWFFCLLGIAIYTGLLYLDINAHFHHMPQDYRIHLLGMWLNFVGSSLVTCFFVSYLKQWGEAQQHQLSAAREANLKNEQLIGIGTVAASTIHSLATPLSTLTILVDHLNRQVDWPAAMRTDLATMQAQVERCRQTINDLSQWTAQHVDVQPLALEELVATLHDHYALQYPDASLRLAVAKSSAHIQLLSDPLLVHALINLINNALESDRETSSVEFSGTENAVTIAITNQTPYPAQQIYHRWGQPGRSSKELGLGIGSLLANSTIERLGGTVTLNIREEANGLNRVLVKIILPILTNP